MALEITKEEVLGKLESGERFVLVDVRSESAYGQGHLPGAVNMPFSTFNPQGLLEHAGRDEQVVVYCYVGVASAKVADMLTDAGFTDVKSMAGGHTAWRFLKGAPADEKARA